MDDVKVYVPGVEKPIDVFPNASHLAKSWSVNRLLCCYCSSWADDDDDMDLFGDETEEEKKAAEERETAKKPKESG